MATTSMYESKAELKDGLMKQLKAYRNISIKSGLLLWIFSMCGHYAVAAYNAEPMGFLILETLYSSINFSIAFAVLGYCVGSIYGAHMQRYRITSISDERSRRRAMLEEQIAIRQSKLDQFSVG